MCGIAGALVGPAGRSPDDVTSTIRRMVDAIRHRGPDDRGIHVDGPLALGHARLSVIDLSTAAHQPMLSPDGAVAVAFNGEIYNFRDLRAQLLALGYSFHSHSDTEVLVHGYDAWGMGLLARLRGMFALAIWDRRARRLVLARDRVGKKPLHYAWIDGTLVFASEIKAILAWPGFRREADLEAIDHYLTLQYVPAPWSAFKGVRKLPAGHWMSVDADGNSRTERYWSLPSPREAAARPAAELQEELIHHLDEAVRLRMVADVPLGAFLSGGVDSSAVVAMMARHAPGRVKTFSIGFEQADYDERRFARMVAERYDTDHHEFVVSPRVLDVLPRLVWNYNEPYADPSALPTFYVSEIARREVTVALNGDGGDESFLGYGRYLQCRSVEWISRIPRPLRRLATRIAEAIPAGLESYRVPRVARRWLSYVSARDARRYAPWIVYFQEQDKRLGYAEAMRGLLAGSTLDLLEPYFLESPSFVGGAAWADLHTYLPDDLLVKVDVASMAHGLEARSPLLDHVLMEWAARIPVARKMAGGQGKAILKAALEPYLPREVLYRPKMGFGSPIDHWLRGALKRHAYDLLLAPEARRRGLFEPDFVRTLLDEHASGARLHHPKLWALLMLESWFRMWIDPADVPLTPPSFTPA